VSYTQDKLEKRNIMEAEKKSDLENRIDELEARLEATEVRLRGVQKMAYCVIVIAVLLALMIIFPTAMIPLLIIAGFFLGLMIVAGLLGTTLKKIFPRLAG
jgi:hypothetical protein